MEQMKRAEQGESLVELIDGDQRERNLAMRALTRVVGGKIPLSAVLLRSAFGAGHLIAGRTMH